MKKDATSRLYVVKEVVPLPSAKKRRRQIPSPMPYTVAKLLVRWAVINGAVLITSNMLAAKLWAIAICDITLTFDAGIIFFPIIYALSDMTSEIFGRKIANRIAWISCVFNAFAFVAFYVADMLPPCEGVVNVEFEKALSLSRIVILGSVVSYLISQLANNFVFDRMRRYTTDANYIVRALVSSVPAHLLDAVIFNVIAFGGRLDSSVLKLHILYAFCTSFVLEGLVLPIEKPYVQYLKLKLKFTNGKRAEIVEKYYMRL